MTSLTAGLAVLIGVFLAVKFTTESGRRTPQGHTFWTLPEQHGTASADPIRSALLQLFRDTTNLST